MVLHRVAAWLCAGLFSSGFAACAHVDARPPEVDRLKQEVLALMGELTPEIGRCVPADRDHLQVRFVLDLKAGRVLEAEAAPDTRSICDGVQVPSASGCSVERRTVVVREAPVDPSVNACLRNAAVGKAAPRRARESFTVSYPFVRARN